MGVSSAHIRIVRATANVDPAVLARNTACEASFATLAADTADEAGEVGAVHRRTVASYVDALERLFVVDDLPAWKPHITSRAHLRGTPITALGP